VLKYVINEPAVGAPIPVPEPYHFGASREVFVHWGEPLKPKDAAKIGMDWLEE
jgi:hypothetical protein